ncbi:hypothetical protein AB0N06_20185 [Streptomyces sp. NPDC051020]|uniref:hypothetical protein n=1 Tax=Streptomyces sp. NPDC051020 TaxID=3155409 RepID=UPI00342C5D06
MPTTPNRRMVAVVLLIPVVMTIGSAAGGAALTLAVWVALGLTAVLAGGRRRAPAAAWAPSTPEPALAD